MILRRFRKSAVKFSRRVLNRLRGGRRILVLGDSHCGVFEYGFDHGLLDPHWLNCEIVGGATAYGLNNDQSATGAWQKYVAALKRYPRFDFVVIVLGECDCSYALWKKAEKLQVLPSVLIEHSMQGIRRLVALVKNRRQVRNIILVGSILPTIEDAMAKAQAIVVRREVAATQQERTRLVLDYNLALSQLAREMGVGYFDLTAQTIDQQTGLLDRRFSAAPDDHHVSHPATGLLWATALRQRL
jgi:hypothetical protein